MRITVLGKSPSWSDAGGACSGYLVEEDDAALLLDCGNGVLAKLRLHRDYAAVDAVVVSHLHADHFLDLVPYAYGLTYAPREAVARPRLHAPLGAAETFRRVTGAWGSEDLIEKAFELREYAPDARVAVGPLRLRFQPVPHFVPTFAVEVVSTVDGSGRFVFGADSGPSDDLVRFAHGADLLLLEATLDEPEPGPDRGHLTAAEAGDHAQRANVGRLVLTHRSDELDPDRARHAAQRRFGGPVTIARDGDVYTV